MVTACSSERHCLTSSSLQNSYEKLERSEKHSVVIPQALRFQLLCVPHVSQSLIFSTHVIGWGFWKPTASLLHWFCCWKSILPTSIQGLLSFLQKVSREEAYSKDRESPSHSHSASPSPTPTPPPALLSPAHLSTATFGYGRELWVYFPWCPVVPLCQLDCSSRAYPSKSLGDEIPGAHQWSMEYSLQHPWSCQKADAHAYHSITSARSKSGNWGICFFWLFIHSHLVPASGRQPINRGTDDVHRMILPQEQPYTCTGAYSGSDILLLLIYNLFTYIQDTPVLIYSQIACTLPVFFLALLELLTSVGEYTWPQLCLADYQTMCSLEALHC